MSDCKHFDHGKPTETVTRLVGECPLCEIECLEDLVHRQAEILSGDALALHGGPRKDGDWSHHDLAELAQKMMEERRTMQMILDGAYG